MPVTNSLLKEANTKTRLFVPISTCHARVNALISDGTNSRKIFKPIRIQDSKNERAAGGGFLFVIRPIF